ncbi:MAG TPA: GAF domain-containing protein [Anaeromyxobacter sp.]|nr:GAF domain-containing protein [Anaeromyxobacter sp.]
MRMASEAALPGASDLRLQRLARLQALTAELSAAATPQDVAHIIFDRGLSLVGARVLTLYWERAPGELELIHGLGVSEEFVQRYRRIGAGTPLPNGEVYRTGEPVWLGTHAAMAERFPEAAALAAAEGDRAWAAIPLLVDRSRGSLGMRFEAERAFDREEREFLLAVARQCAQALERARLFEAQRRLADRLASLQAITSELSGALTVREVAAVVLRHLLGLGVRGGVVCSLGTGRLEPVLEHEAADLRDALLAPSPSAEALSSGEVVWLEEPGAPPGPFPALSELRARPGAGTIGVLPLRIEGRNVGLLAVAFEEARTPAAEDRSFAQALAQQGAQALERAHLYEVQRLQAERLAHLHAATAALSGAVAPSEVAAAAHTALSALGAVAVELHAFTGPDRLELVARAGPAGTEAGSADASDPVAEVVRTGRALWIESRQELEERFPELAAGRSEGTFAVVPLLAGGTADGALAVSFPGSRRLDAEDRIFVRTLAMPCAQAMERTRLTDAAAHDRRAAEWMAALLEGALAAAPVGLALLDEAMRVIRTSEGLARTSGLSPEAQRGRTPQELFPGLPAEALRLSFERALSSGQRVDQVVSGEPRGAAGETRRFSITWYPVRVAGRIVGVGMLIREAR